MSHLDQFSTPFLPLVITGFLVSGMLVGLGGRWLLGRLRRGAVFHPPWCELSVAACWALAGWRWAVGGMPAWWLPVPLLLAAFGVCLAAVDLAQRRLPDALTLACYPALGGALAVVHWRWVFLVSVPVGIIGTIWSYRSLHETGERNPGRMDWAGNLTFLLGLTAVLYAVGEAISWARS